MLDYNKISKVWSGIRKEFENPDNRVIFVSGGPGLGKSFAAYSMAPERFEAGLMSLTLGEESSFVELRGSYLLKGMEAVWCDGPVSESMRCGAARMVINEPAHAGPDILTGLYPVLDSLESAKLTLPTGDTLTPQSGWHCVLTDNQPADRLPSALQDRIDAIIEVDVPAPGLLAKVLPKLHEPMVAAATDSKIPTFERIGCRSWVRLSVRLRAGQSLKEASVYTWGRERGTQIADQLKLKFGVAGKKIEETLLEDAEEQSVLF